MSRQIHLSVPDAWYDLLVRYATSHTRTPQNMLIHAMDQHMRRYPVEPQGGPRKRSKARVDDFLTQGGQTQGRPVPVPARAVSEEAQNAD